jgi:quercetin dioxygenase-like cupin family protein
LVIAEPGGGTRLHRHKYDEVVYVISGRPHWTVNGQEHEARAGDVFVVKAGEPHRFVSSDADPVYQIDIHLNAIFEQELLE